MAVLAPGGPEFQQHDFAFYRLVVEALAGSGFGAETWGRFVVVIAGEDGSSEENQANYQHAKPHGAE